MLGGAVDGYRAGFLQLEAGEDSLRRLLLDLCVMERWNGRERCAVSVRMLFIIINIDIIQKYHNWSPDLKGLKNRS